MKKAIIVLDALIGILIAGIIVFFVFTFVSNSFRLTTQSKENFLQFDNDLVVFSESFTGDRQTATLILDEGTALVYFEKEASEVSLAAFQDLGGDPETKGDLRAMNLHFIKPAQCTERACLCLFREIKTSEEDKKEVSLLQLDGTRRNFDSKHFYINAETTICDDMIGINLKMPLCAVGVSRAESNTLGYTCEQGVVIERGIVKDVVTNFYFEAPRRIVLQLEKKEGYILLIG